MDTKVNVQFASKKDGFFVLLLVIAGLATLAVVVLTFYHNVNTVGKLIVIIAHGAMAVLMFWIYLDTGYALSKEYLSYHSGPLKGSIAISHISKVTRGRTLWVGTNKPALARNGLIINYERFNEIYISPEQEELFLEMLLEQNPSIKIIEAGESSVY